MHTLILVDSLQCYLYQSLSYIACEVDSLGLNAVFPTLSENCAFVILLAVIIAGSDHSKLRNNALSGKVLYRLPYIGIYFAFYSIPG